MTQRKREGARTRARRQARQCLLQALYQWQLTGHSAADMIDQFSEDGRLDDADGDYFSAALSAITAEATRFEACFDPLLDRPAVQLDPVEKAALLLGTYEFAEREDIPVRVVINEAVELVKRFGAEGGHRFVNGVLDKLARQLRPNG